MNWFKKWSQRLAEFCMSENRLSIRRPHQSAHPMIEVLEDRLLLSVSLLWVGDNAANPGWIVDNFRVLAITDPKGETRLLGDKEAPRDNDTVIFDTTKKAGGIQGTAIDSTDNLKGLTLRQLIIQNYKGTITLKQTLTVQSLQMTGGTITSDKKIDLLISQRDLDEKLTSSIGGGATLSGMGQIIIASNLAAQAEGFAVIKGLTTVLTTLTINGDITIDKRTLVIGAKEQTAGLNWKGGKITLRNATIENNSQWIIDCDNNIVSEGKGESKFVIQGSKGYIEKRNTATKQGAATQISVPITVTSTVGGDLGAISIKQGSLILSGGTGTIASKVTTGDNAQFIVRSHQILNNGARFDGFVNVQSGGDLFVSEGVTVRVTRLKLSGNAGVGGKGELQVFRQLEWVSGTMSDRGITTLLIGAGAVIGGPESNPNNLPVLDGRTLNITSTFLANAIRLVGGGKGAITLQLKNGATINTAKNTIFNIEDDSGIKHISQKADDVVSTFNNIGTLQKTGGMGISKIEGMKFNNTGNVKPSTIKEGQPGKLHYPVGKVALQGGTFEVGPGGTSVASSVDQTGGAMLLDAGTLTLTGSYRASAGSVNLGGGVLTATQNVVLSSLASLSGSGTINGGVNPGDAPLYLGGNLDLNIGGATPVTGYDQIQANTNVVLSGSLSINLVNGYKPTSTGQTFTLLYFPAASGTFASVTGLTNTDVTNPYEFRLQYNSTSVTLLVVTKASASLPTVTGLGTTSGSRAGGSSVVLSGSNFYDSAGVANVSAVLFGTVPATSFTVNSSRQVTAVSPAGATGIVHVSVVTSGGTTAPNSADQFTYNSGAAPSVTGLDVSDGYTFGGTPVLITGTNFQGATGVSFGSTAALAFDVLSATKIRAWAPPASVATVDIQVTTYSGTSNSTSADDFTYSTHTAPAVSSLSLSSGSTAGGNEITITGSDFLDVTGVYFGSLYAGNYSVASSTSLSVLVPPNFAGTYDVMVGSLGGISPVSSAQYTYQAAPEPQVTSVTASSGTTSGGNLVTISGNNFGGTLAVLFGDEPADDYTIASPTTIYAVAPAHASGVLDIKVVTTAGSSASLSGSHYTYNNASAPTITAVSPSSGSTAGGAVLVLTGTNLAGTTSVLFGSDSADFEVLSDTALVVTTPAHAAGSATVTVQTHSGSTTSSYTYSAASAPTVAALSDSSGPTTGGNVVVIDGSYFTGASAVRFGSTDADWFTVLDDSSILALAPERTAGLTDITITTGGGTSSTSAASHYTFTAASAPTVTGVSSSSGSAAGGSVITLTGTGFVGVSDVTIGGVSATDVVVNSDTQITAVTPPHAAGDWDVRVTAAAGSSALSSAARYTYTSVSAPAITGLSSYGGSAAGGATVTISGSGFTAASAVLFGSASADFTVNSDTEIVVTTPPSLPGTVRVLVVAPGGSSAPGAFTGYSYSPAAAPVISSLGTTTGGSGGGAEVRILGTGFTAATGIQFGSTAAQSFWVVSATEARAIAPPHAAGAAGVTLATTSGTSNSASFTYTAAPAPAVTGLSASSGSAAGGAVVTITGSNFLGASAVSFGGTAAADFEVLSDKAIVATAPARASGTGVVDVRITTPSGLSSIVSADQYTYNWVTASAPAVTALDVNTGAAAGGTTVLLAGTGFAAASAVKFGTTNATSFTVLSDTQIRAVAPAGTAGATNLFVTTPGGTSSTGAGNAFTYVSASVPVFGSVSSGTFSTAGGMSVTITGLNFTGATAVLFGSVPATSFTVVSAMQITAVTPPQPAGAVSISITTPAGTLTTPAGFSYANAPAPTLSSLGTTSGTSAGGTSVTINGGPFTGATGVRFGDYPAAFTVVSASQITATTPAQAAGTVDVVVQSYSGASTPAAPSRYTFTTAAAPSVSSLGTTTGSTAGGTSVTINGSNLSGATAVFFGDIEAASFTVVSATQLTATSPSQAAGLVEVVVRTPSGTSAVSGNNDFTYNAAAAPAVTSLSPSSGSTGGGGTITLTGTDFTGATEVLFGTVSASFSVVSATSISAVVPSQAAGAVYVRVRTPSGLSSTGSGNEYTYSAAAAPSVSNVTANGGSAMGGTVVTVTGSNFLGASVVKFGDVEAWDFRVLSDTALTATAPAQAAATVDVRITTPSGTSSVVTADRFTYSAVAAPTLTAVSPFTGGGAGGATVTLTGSGFSTASAVRFGDSAAEFSIVSDTSIQATAPAGFAGTVDVVVVNGGGLSALSAATRYTFTTPAAPSITGLAGGSGSTAGGTTVTISGSGFDAASAVLFGDVPAASFTLLSSSSIRAVSPSQAAATVDVRVVTPGGVSAPVTADRYTYTAAAAPTLTSISPASGSATGGMVVTLIGSNFTAATGVSFGSTSASFVVHSATRISAVAPAGTAGTASVTVTTHGGTSSGVTFTYTSASAPTVSSLSVSGGGTEGGTELTVIGTSFLGASAVKFGTVTADDFTVLSDTALRVRAPAGSAGTIAVTVVGPGGTSGTSSASDFTYSAASAPTVTAVSPTTVSTAGTTLVTLTGTNFLSVSAVRFGAVLASTVIIHSETKITAIAPAQAAGAINVVVTSAGGTSTSGSGNSLTYSAAAAPALSSLSATSGPTTGGAGILLTGSGFLGASSVRFGSVAAAFTVYSDSSIVALVPAQAVGPVSVTVSTPSGMSSGVLYTYFANLAPAANNDVYTVSQNSTLTTAAPGVRTNDVDLNADAIFVSAYSLPAHGILTILGDGSFIYKPAVGYMGSDSFTYRISDATVESGTATVTIQVTSFQLAAGGELLGGEDLPALTMEELQPVLDEAIIRWVRAGIGAEELARLREVPVHVLDLPGGALGLSNQHVVTLDVNAAGYGWFIDATPADDGEFAARASGPAARHVDLLTVVAHELGHVLGLPDQDARPDDLMFTTLGAGVRRIPARERTSVNAAGPLPGPASLALEGFLIDLARQPLPETAGSRAAIISWPMQRPAEIAEAEPPRAGPDQQDLDLFFTRIAERRRQPQPWEAWTDLSLL